MTDLSLERFDPFIEPMTKMVSLHVFPSGRDCDNHLLFTATAAALYGLYSEYEILTLTAPFQIEPGAFARWPGENHPSSWDDHLGLAVASPVLAQGILNYAAKHDWTWGDNWLGRIPLFVPVDRKSVV
jgi:hypothetical protein